MYDMDEKEVFDADGRLSGYSECLEMLRRHQANYRRRIEYLENENRKLKDEHFKDNYIKKLQNENERILSDSRRGFPITEEEDRAIRKWQQSHLTEKHPEALKNQGYFGPIGGNWTFTFIPTSIGIIGEVSCYCGEKYCFSDLL